MSFSILLSVFDGEAPVPKTIVHIKGQMLECQAPLTDSRIKATLSHAIASGFQQFKDPSITQIKGTFTAVFSGGEPVKVLQMKFTQLTNP